MLAVLLMLMSLGVAPADVSTGGKRVGRPDAPIMIEVFSDYQCPACKMLHEQILPQLREDYVWPGKVYLVYRDFPLAMHAYSRQAAYYACAAARIGKYQQVADALFARQTAWAADGKVDQAACSGLTAVEANKVRALAKDPAIAAEVQRDTELGQKDNVTQTPTMIITHRLRQYPLSGAVNYDLLRRFLDELSAK